MAGGEARRARALGMLSRGTYGREQAEGAGRREGSARRLWVGVRAQVGSSGGMGACGAQEGRAHTSGGQTGGAVCG